ncbi:hypothetical protein DSBG_4195 [Desulfosporosinus sp. BG]|nr:hypothetical protein DSBG_4195 [Desulfosporosinus sp. BG]
MCFIERMQEGVMKKETINGLNGYDIPCLNNLSGGERRRDNVEYPN